MNEAELLFTEILNCNRLFLYQNKDLFLNKDKSYFVASALKKRLKGEPLQYILSKTEFMGLEFRVNKNVFIPRPDTELLVETVVEIAAHSKLRFTEQSILDIGTGSGCIAISLAKFLSNIKIVATDISGKALETAQYNAVLNNVHEKIKFIQGDLFSQYSIKNTQYDIIVSNPPYIPTAEIDNLEPEIRYEPRIALDGGKDGLSFYRRLINHSPRYLREGGLLIMELGFNQRGAVKNIFQNSGYFEIIEVVKDYNNIDRVIVAKKMLNPHILNE